VYRNEGLGILPWSPLSGGWLSGKFDRSTEKPEEGSRLEIIVIKNLKENYQHIFIQWLVGRKSRCGSYELVNPNSRTYIESA
jgi:aryl-alcohol dehydrogenase-like predicted oxidoreductase